MRLEGRLNMLGEGRFIRHGWTRRAVVEIGEHEIRNLQYSPYLASFIETNRGEPMALGVQSILGGKTVYAIAMSDGRVRREGPGWLFAILAIYAMLTAYCAINVSVHGSAWWLGIALTGWLSIAPLKALRICRSFAPLPTVQVAQVTAPVEQMAV